MTPTALGPYVLTDRLGRTGMVELYRALHAGPNGFEKMVAVRAMRSTLVHDGELVARFTAEATVGAQLSHPGIVQVFDYGVDAGIPYFVTEQLDAVKLSQLLGALTAADRRLPSDVAIAIAAEMCQALGYAHAWRDRQGTRRPIVHGAVSPENVLVCGDGSIKLLGFGATRGGDALDCRVDVLAAGIVLHEMLHGPRWSGASGETPALEADVPRELAEVLRKASARDPDERFADGDSMAAALQLFAPDGGGRRSVAALVGSLFPDRWQTHCEACRERMVPALLCVRCGTDGPAARAKGDAETAASARPPVAVGAAPAAGAPILHVDLAREKPPAQPPPPPRPNGARVTRPTRASGVAYRVLFAAAVAMTLLVVGFDLRARRQSAAPPSASAPSVVEPAAPVAASAPPVVVTPPSAAVTAPPATVAAPPVAAAAPPVAAAPPAVAAAPAASAPRAVAAASKKRLHHAARQQELVRVEQPYRQWDPPPPSPPTPAPSPPATAPKPASDPRLLDPFAGGSR